MRHLWDLGALEHPRRHPPALRKALFGRSLNPDRVALSLLAGNADDIRVPYPEQMELSDLCDPLALEPLV